MLIFVPPTLCDNQVLEDGDKMPGAKFFPGARLNFAQNLLRYRDDRTALRFRCDASTKDTLVTYRFGSCRVWGSCTTAQLADTHTP